MDAEHFDAAVNRWLHRQPDPISANYHIQIKLWNSEVEMSQLTVANLTGWVIMDWRHRGLGLSARRALPVSSRVPHVARRLDAISGDLIHVQVQVVYAPEPDWRDAYPKNTLAPDLMPVLDAGHASVLSIFAERDHGDWRILKAQQPPDDSPVSLLD